MNLAIKNWMTAALPRPTASVSKRVSSKVAAWSRLRWIARRWLRQLGRPGTAGIAVLAMCPVLYFSAIYPAQERLDAMQQKSISLSERIKRAAALPEAERLMPAEQLVSFYQLFPNEKNSPKWLEKLIGLAHDNGLNLDQGEYKVARDSVGKLVRFRMIFPVKGEYVQIRKFLSALPAELPVFSLEKVQFDRQKVSDPAVEAKIGLVLYLGKTS